MKRFYLVFVLFVLILAACTEDKDQEPSVVEVEGVENSILDPGDGIPAPNGIQFVEVSVPSPQAWTPGDYIEVTWTVSGLLSNRFDLWLFGPNNYSAKLLDGYSDINGNETGVKSVQIPTALVPAGEGYRLRINSQDESAFSSYFGIYDRVWNFDDSGQFVDNPMFDWPRHFRVDDTMEEQWWLGYHSYTGGRSMAFKHGSSHVEDGVTILDYTEKLQEYGNVPSGKEVQVRAYLSAYGNGTDKGQLYVEIKHAGVIKHTFYQAGGAGTWHEHTYTFTTSTSGDLEIRIYEDNGEDFAFADYIRLLVED